MYVYYAYVYYVSRTLATAVAVFLIPIEVHQKISKFYIIMIRYTPFLLYFCCYYSNS